MKSLVFLLAIFAAVSCQVLVPENCPNVTVVQDFDVVRYLGLWQEISRFNLLWELGNCSTAEYGPVNDGVVKVTNREIVDGVESTIVGRATLADPNSTEAKLKVEFDTPPSTADYWVLGTDYDNYSLVWSCGDFGGASFQAAWVLGRTKPLPADITETINNLLTSNGVNGDYFKTHDTPDCASFP